jgi:poly-D-alanine transfer protein DltD
MTSGQVSENRELTSRERWLRQHRELRFYFKHDEYELLESLAAEEHLTVKDFILKLAKELEMLRAESSTLRILGVNCKPTRIVECINELRDKLVLQQLEYIICTERLKQLMPYYAIFMMLLLSKKLKRSSH